MNDKKSNIISYGHRPVIGWPRRFKTTIKLLKTDKRAAMRMVVAAGVPSSLKLDDHLDDSAVQAVCDRLMARTIKEAGYNFAAEWPPPITFPPVRHKAVIVGVLALCLNLIACEGQKTRTPEQIRELVEQLDPDGKLRAKICERVVSGG